MKQHITRPAAVEKLPASDNGSDSAILSLEDLAQWFPGLAKEPAAAARAAATWPEEAPRPAAPQSEARSLEDVLRSVEESALWVDAPPPDEVRRATSPNARAVRRYRREERRMKAAENATAARWKMCSHNARVEAGEERLKRLCADAIRRAKRTQYNASHAYRELATLPRTQARRLKAAAEGRCGDGPRVSLRENSASGIRARNVVALGVLLYHSAEFRRKRGTMELSGVSQSCLASLLGVSLASIKRTGRKTVQGVKASRQGLDGAGWQDGTAGYLVALAQTGFLRYHQPPAADVAGWAKGPVRYNERGEQEQFAYCVYQIWSPTRESVESLAAVSAESFTAPLLTRESAERAPPS